MKSVADDHDAALTCCVRLRTRDASHLSRKANCLAMVQSQNEHCTVSSLQTLCAQGPRESRNLGTRAAFVRRTVLCRCTGGPTREVLGLASTWTAARRLPIRVEPLQGKSCVAHVVRVTTRAAAISGRSSAPLRFPISPACCSSEGSVSISSPLASGRPLDFIGHHRTACFVTAVARIGRDVGARPMYSCALRIRDCDLRPCPGFCKGRITKTRWRSKKWTPLFLSSASPQQL